MTRPFLLETAFSGAERNPHLFGWGQDEVINYFQRFRRDETASRPTTPLSLRAQRSHLRIAFLPQQNHNQPIAHPQPPGSEHPLSNTVYLVPAYLIPNRLMIVPGVKRNPHLLLVEASFCRVGWGCHPTILNTPLIAESRGKQTKDTSF